MSKLRQVISAAARHFRPEVANPAKPRITIPVKPGNLGTAAGFGVRIIVRRKHRRQINVTHIQ